MSVAPYNSYNFLSMPTSTYHIRPIAPQDNAAVAEIIRTVMPEFGAVGPGFAIEDAEVDTMYEAYQAPGAAYFVVADASGKIWGGAGIAPLEQAAEKICELRKMYFLPELRGKGLGKQMIGHCLQVAEEQGYRYCYLETLSGMHQAQRLYEHLGFERLTGPMGNTGHFSCDKYYLRSL